MLWWSYRVYLIVMLVQINNLIFMVTFKYRWLLNRGDHMDQFDCNIIVVFVLGVPWNMETVSLDCKYGVIKLSF
jgi:hypothetical protein